MEDRARRDATTAVEAARQRLARLKFASLTASVMAFAGLTAAIAIEVSAAPVTASSATVAPPVAQPTAAAVPYESDDYGDQVAPGMQAAPGNPSVAPRAAAPPIVSAQS
jgi:hypothetical protein